LSLEDRDNIPWISQDQLTPLHSVTSQKTIILAFNVVETLNIAGETLLQQTW